MADKTRQSRRQRAKKARADHDRNSRPSRRPANHSLSSDSTWRPFLLDHRGI